MLTNNTYKSCLKCKYFIPHLSTDIKEIISKGKCYKNKKFCNIINDFDYEYIKDCRKSIIKCGREARYFEKSKYKNQIIYTKYIASLPYLFLYMGSAVYFYYIGKFIGTFIGGIIVFYILP